MSISPFARREESSAGCENDKRINAVMYSNKCSGILYRPRDRGINRSNKPGWKIETSIRIATLFVSGERGGIRRRLMMQSATKRGEKGEARRGGDSFPTRFLADEEVASSTTQRESPSTNLISLVPHKIHTAKRFR